MCVFCGDTMTSGCGIKIVCIDTNFIRTRRKYHKEFYYFLVYNLTYSIEVQYPGESAFNSLLMARTLHEAYPSLRPRSFYLSISNK